LRNVWLTIIYFGIEKFPVSENGWLLDGGFEALCRVAFIGVLMTIAAGCQPPPPPPPPLPRLTESCTFTNTPDVIVPADRAVERVLAGRRGVEPSLVSVAVRVGDDFRQDGTMYVPGPDPGSSLFHQSYRILRKKQKQRRTETGDGFHALEFGWRLL
jgi:hypothetical protein